MQRRECAHDWEEMVQLAEKAPPFQILINRMILPWWRPHTVDAINQLATQTGQPQDLGALPFSFRRSSVALPILLGDA